MAKKPKKRSSKVADKTGRKSGTKASPPGGFKKGKDPRRGRGPKPGALNAGRPRKEHIEWCQKVVSDAVVEAAVLAVLRNPKHGQFSVLYGKVSERGYGKPTGMEVQLPINPKDLTDEQLERIAGGQDPLIVLATTGRGGAGAPAPEGGGSPGEPAPA